MRKHSVIIDRDLCIGCGLCLKDCVASDIVIKDGKAIPNNKGCIACGHCEAICPKNAVTVTGFDEKSIPYDEQTRLDPDELLKAIQTRRTIRNFTEQKVEDDILHQIIEAGRLAPTGGNSQSTGYVVLKNPSKVEFMAVSMFQKLIKAGKVVIPFLANMEIDDHFFFKKAPLVIVITGNKVNASLAAENMAFMAEAHGLGVLYSGFFTMCVNSNPKIKKALQMDRKEKAVTTLVIGYPSVKYHRTVKREPAKVRIIE